MAQHVVQSGRIALRIPKTEVDEHFRKRLDALISEGVVREHSMGWEFFHQTFAEFAHARWALTHGVESTEVRELAGRATSGATNVWPVLVSLLLQIDDIADYRTAAAMLPMSSADAVQAQTLGALQRAEPEALRTVMAALSEQHDLLTVTLAALGDAPVQHVPVAVAGALDAMRQAPKQASVAIGALARLVPREATSADLLGEVLKEVSALSGVTEEQRDGYLERLVKPFTTIRSNDDKLAVLRTAYKSLGKLGRRDAIRAHQLNGVSQPDLVSLAKVALDHACPPLDDREQIDLLAVLWQDPTERSERSWSSWRDLLAAPLKKDWDNAQVKFVVHLASQDDTVAAELFDELMQGRTRSHEPHVNAVAQVVAERAEWVAERLLAGDPPNTDIALSALGKIGPDLAAGLDHATRERMIGWLSPVRSTDPRMVWPTQFILAADDLHTHQLLLAQLRTADPEPAVLLGVVQSICYHVPLRTLERLAADLRELVDTIRPRANSPATERLRLRARLEGRLAESNADARLWIEQQVVTGASPSVAGTVVKTIADTHLDGLPESMATWVGTLLDTPHTDAAERLAQLLLGTSVADAESATKLIRKVVERMRVAADNHEDSRLHRSLLNLVIGFDRIHPTGGTEVLAIHEILQLRLLRRPDTSASDRPAALRDLSTLSGTLMAKHLDAKVIRNLTGYVLTGLDGSWLGAKLVKKITSLLFGILGRDPDAPEWLNSVFGATAIALPVQEAIAEALLLYEANLPGGYASALKDRPDCPTEIMTLLVRRLQTSL